MVLMMIITTTEANRLERKSTIKYGWGMMFDYYGEMLHGLNKYNMMIGVNVPNFEELNLKIPDMIDTNICSHFSRTLPTDRASVKVITALRPVCEKAMESHHMMKLRIQEVKREIKELIQDRMPYILRKFNHVTLDEDQDRVQPEVNSQVLQAVEDSKRSTLRNNHGGELRVFNERPMESITLSEDTIKSRQGRSVHKTRNRRFISELISLGIQGVSAFMAHRKQSKLEQGFKLLLKHDKLQDREIRAIKKDMMSLTRATFAGIKDLKEDLDRNSQRINSLIGEVDDMAYVLKAHNDAITDVKHAIIFMNHYFNQIYVRLERYLDLFKNLKADTLQFLQAIELVSLNKMPQGLISNTKLNEMIVHVQEQLTTHYPSFELVTTEVEDYYQMPLVSATYALNLIVIQIPMYIKPKIQQPLSVYRVKTLPVPYHMNGDMIDEHESKYAYTEVINTSEMIAMNKETYVALEPYQINQCVRLSTIYFCEKLLLIKHKSQHTCESAIYHDQPAEVVKAKCDIQYHIHLDPKPQMFDAGSTLLLSNLPRPWIARCDQDNQIPNNLKAGPYVIVQKHELCQCSIEAGNPVWKVERNIDYCTDNKTGLTLYHTVNMAVMIYQFNKQLDNLTLKGDYLSLKPTNLDPVEPEFKKISKIDIAKRRNKPLLLEEAMTSVGENVKYLTGEDYNLAMNTLDSWFTEDNSILGFMFVACIVVLVLIPLVFIVLVKYFGLKVHFGKMNSTISKLVTASSVLKNLPQARAEDTFAVSSARFIDNAIMGYELLLTILTVYGLYKIGRIIYKWYNFQNLGFVQTQESMVKFLTYDKTDIFLQLTNTFGAHTIQIHLGTFFGNPDDLTILGELPLVKPLELETGYIIDIISFNWKTYQLVLRDMPLTLPLSKTVSGLNKIFVRTVFKCDNGMYKLIAYNRNSLKVNILKDYCKLQSSEIISPPKHPRLNLAEPFYMDVDNVPKIVSNAIQLQQPSPEEGTGEYEDVARMSTQDDEGTMGNDTRM